MASITMLAPLTYDRIGHKLAVMATNHPITAILQRWETRRDVYEDARAANPDLDMVAVHRWFKRGSLPPKYDAALLQGAERRGIGLHPMEIVKARSGHIDQAGHSIAPIQPRRPRSGKSAAEVSR
ncbi:hypothetical protein ACHFJ0_04880 [Paracoccus sp. NGMCC 1.201697]|uniref:Uncharacterized protein n=1 Tax=Paracoccus broussonetiae subsp. drimophilus TaxID=3373869 RepID=A0ABW7LH71_9RHOB